MPDTHRKSIAITRPVGRGEETAELVRSLGWTPFIFHTVELEPFASEKIREEISSCLKRGPIDWIVFMSSNGASLLFESLESCPEVKDSLLKSNLLAVGPRTRGALVRHGVSQAMLPERYSSAGIDEFFSQKNAEGQKIILVRSSAADDSLAKSLASKRAIVMTLNVYDSALPRDLISTFDFLKGLSANKFEAVLFTSAKSVSNLFRIAGPKFPGDEISRLLAHVVVGAIGPVTAEELKNRGIDAALPQTYLIENAVRVLTELYSRST